MRGTKKLPTRRARGLLSPTSDVLAGMTNSATNSTATRAFQYPLSAQPPPYRSSSASASARALATPRTHPVERRSRSWRPKVGRLGEQANQVVDRIGCKGKGWEERGKGAVGGGAIVSVAPRGGQEVNQPRWRTYQIRERACGAGNVLCRRRRGRDVSIVPETARRPATARATRRRRHVQAERRDRKSVDRKSVV